MLTAAGLTTKVLETALSTSELYSFSEGTRPEYRQGVAFADSGLATTCLSGLSSSEIDSPFFIGAFTMASGAFATSAGLAGSSSELDLSFSAEAAGLGADASATVLAGA